MDHVFHRNPLHDYPVAVAGDGCYLYDRDGKRYLDASGGAAVSCLGHSDRAVIDAITRQLEALPFAHTSFFANEPMEQLADALIATAPKPLERVYLTSGGSEAMEAALKLARQYFVEKGEPQRAQVIGRRQSYHGNTLGALAVGGNEWRRSQFAPLLIDVKRVSPCFEYRERRDDESQEAYTDRLVAEWHLDSSPVIAAIADKLDSSVAVPVTVELPAELEQWKKEDPVKLKALQARIREEFMSWFARGYDAVGVRSSAQGSAYLLQSVTDSDQRVRKAY